MQAGVLRREVGCHDLLQWFLLQWFEHNDILDIQLLKEPVVMSRQGALIRDEDEARPSAGPVNTAAKELKDSHLLASQSGQVKVGMSCF